MTIMTRSEAKRELAGQYGLSAAQAIRALAIADQMGVNAEGGGTRTVTITAMHNGKEQYKIEPGLPPIPEAKTGKRRYTSTRRSTPTTTKEVGAMPRGRTATAPAKAEENGQPDYTERATRPATPTMVRFADWLVEKVYEGDFPLKDRDSFNEGVKLAGTLKAEFQASPENKEARAAIRQEHLDYAAGVAERREAREAAKAEREAAKAEKAQAKTTEPATPKRRGRPPKAEAKPTEAEAKLEAARTAAPRRRGRPPGQPAAREADRPARGRGRPAKDAPAPY